MTQHSGYGWSVVFLRIHSPFRHGTVEAGLQRKCTRRGQLKGREEGIGVPGRVTAEIPAYGG